MSTIGTKNHGELRPMKYSEKYKGSGLEYRMWLNHSSKTLVA